MTLLNASIDEKQQEESSVVSGEKAKKHKHCERRYGGDIILLLLPYDSNHFLAFTQGSWKQNCSWMLIAAKPWNQQKFLQINYVKSRKEELLLNTKKKWPVKFLRSRENLNLEWKMPI